jgi:cytochrome P450
LFNRPDALKDAIAASNAYDVKKMYGFVSEALRFNPVQPGVIRFNEMAQTLSGKGQKKYRIKAKRKVFALTAAAMFDPAAFPDPKKFIAGREAVYMNYGFALHECYGRYINAVTLSEFVSAILRLKNVRREKGITGRGAGITQQSFPNNFVVCFDSPGTA